MFPDVELHTGPSLKHYLPESQTDNPADRFLMSPWFHVKIGLMHIALFVMRALELLFFAGLAGASIVILLSFFHDAKELLNED